MKYTIDGDKIFIPETEDFCPAQILECGQVFRYSRGDDGHYSVNAADKRCEIVVEKPNENSQNILLNPLFGNVTIYSKECEFFRKYFDLDTDYSIIKKKLNENAALKEAVEFGKGIRILRQDRFETIISFIISANNNIKRIQKIIEGLCSGLGEDKNGYFAFPTVEKLAAQSVEYYRSRGLGYRAEYVLKTARAVAGGFDLDLSGLNSAEARKYISKLSGVGPKVADCILLFGYGITDVFPTDVWIERVYGDLFGDGINLTRLEKSKRLTDGFKELSGYAQQYLFYAKRSGK
ncbi:MAG: hypothetical protein LBN25_01710 [Christensenellaceae bacterium]|jgi:N-glycosylase/DNA lyase|nr:hypothetical protein [Christensenellaceae bacterium]